MSSTLFVDLQSPSNAITVVQSGNVGIGTTNPQSSLHVMGNVNASGYVSFVNGVVQMIIEDYTSSNSYVNTISTTFIDTALNNGTITPKFASSKIAIEFFTSMANCDGPPLVVNIVRSINGGTYAQILPARQYSWSYAQGIVWSPLIFKFVDLPNTTGTVTYKIQFRSANGVNVVLLHPQMGYSWSLIEIKQ